MPRPGQTPTPAFKRSPEMPYGTVGPANAARPQRAPQAQQQAAGGTNPASPEEEFLFGPTLRPTEPLTAGAPFGPGPGSPLDGGVPEHLRRALPMLQQMTLDPQAPPQLRVIVDYLLHKAR